MESIFEKFKLNSEREDYQEVINSIDRGVVFKGTNLWVLVFAIFIASLGLNVNSTAVIIGAMLVSPLMGPIMGLGLGMAINDLALIRKAIYNYLFAACVGLATSTIFFLTSPINDAHSEILARTAPNIYDVLIAFFGGLAGILATSSKKKGNVIPGVAIATALMPPLCTAGYGLATWELQYVFGALYLFFINSVFIAFATIITARFLQFPYTQLPEEKDELKAKRIIWAVVIITLLPSIYFGYDIVQQDKFKKQAIKFIEIEAVFPNDYLLQKSIDPEKKAITLIYGGELIEEKEIELLKSKLPQYNLQKATLEIRQGFSYLNENTGNEQTNQLTSALVDKDKEIQHFKNQMDSLNDQKHLGARICKELKVQYPSTQSCIVQKVLVGEDSLQRNTWIAIINTKRVLSKNDKHKIKEWMKVRIETGNLKIYFEE